VEKGVTKGSKGEERGRGQVKKLRREWGKIKVGVGLQTWTWETNVMPKRKGRRGIVQKQTKRGKSAKNKREEKQIEKEDPRQVATSGNQSTDKRMKNKCT